MCSGSLTSRFVDQWVQLRSTYLEIFLAKPWMNDLTCQRIDLDLMQSGQSLLILDYPIPNFLHRVEKFVLDWARGKKAVFDGVFIIDGNLQEEEFSSIAELIFQHWGEKINLSLAEIEHLLQNQKVLLLINRYEGFSPQARRSLKSVWGRVQAAIWMTSIPDIVDSEIERFFCSQYDDRLNSFEIRKIVHQYIQDPKEIIALETLMSQYGDLQKLLAYPGSLMTFLKWREKEKGVISHLNGIAQWLHAFFFDRFGQGNQVFFHYYSELALWFFVKSQSPNQEERERIFKEVNFQEEKMPSRDVQKKAFSESADGVDFLFPLLKEHLLAFALYHRIQNGVGLVWDFIFENRVNSDFSMVLLILSGMLKNQHENLNKLFSRLSEDTMSFGRVEELGILIKCSEYSGRQDPVLLSCIVFWMQARKNLGGISILPVFNLLLMIAQSPILLSRFSIAEIFFEISDRLPNELLEVFLDNVPWRVLTADQFSAWYAFIDRLFQAHDERDLSIEKWFGLLGKIGPFLDDFYQFRIWSLLLGAFEKPHHVYLWHASALGLCRWVPFLSLCKKLELFEAFSGFFPTSHEMKLIVFSIMFEILGYCEALNYQSNFNALLKWMSRIFSSADIQGKLYYRSKFIFSYLQKPHHEFSRLGVGTIFHFFSFARVLTFSLIERLVSVIFPYATLEQKKLINFKLIYEKFKYDYPEGPWGFRVMRFMFQAVPSDWIKLYCCWGIHSSSENIKRQLNLILCTFSFLTERLQDFAVNQLKEFSDARRDPEVVLQSNDVIEKLMPVLSLNQRSKLIEEAKSESRSPRRNAFFEKIVFIPQHIWVWDFHQRLWSSSVEGMRYFMRGYRHLLPEEITLCWVSLLLYFFKKEGGINLQALLPWRECLQHCPVPPVMRRLNHFWLQYSAEIRHHPERRLLVHFFESQRFFGDIVMVGGVEKHLYGGLDPLIQHQILENPLLLESQCHQRISILGLWYDLSVYMVRCPQSAEQGLQCVYQSMIQLLRGVPFEKIYSHWKGIDASDEEFQELYEHYENRVLPDSPPRPFSA